MYCPFEDRCTNSNSECDYCHFNVDACTQDFFEYDEDCDLPEPTEEEKEEAIN